MQVVAYNSWIQRVCPAPRRYLAQLVVRFGLKTGLDVGCGESSPLTPLRKNGFRSIGLDASPERLENARRRSEHDEYYCADILTFPLDSLPPVDVVVMSHVIEHLSREDGLRLLQVAERFARRLIYVETPRGFMEQLDCLQGDLLQEHRSGWFPWDFEARGYMVFGSGLGLLRPRHGRPSALPESLTRWTGRLAQAVVFRNPQWSSAIAAIQYRDEQGNIRTI
jgi:hypothetical protein